MEDTPNLEEQGCWQAPSQLLGWDLFLLRTMGCPRPEEEPCPQETRERSVEEWRRGRSPNPNKELSEIPKMSLLRPKIANIRPTNSLTSKLRKVQR